MMRSVLEKFGLRRYFKNVPTKRIVVGIGIGLIVVGILGLVVIDQTWSPVPPEPSPYYTSADGSLLRVELNQRQQYRIPVELEEVHPNLVRAVLATEDERFFYHPGIDPLAILRAMYQNIKTGSIQSGGSTLTMQLARIFAPGPRTVWRKLLEMGRALTLEIRYTKRELLEMYLNNIPMGGNVRGVETAARRYFGRSAANLTPAQAASLASIPKHPGKFHPVRRPRNLKQRRNYVLNRMWEEGYLPREQRQIASNQPVRARIHPFPFKAPHFVDLLPEQQGGERRTSLRLGVQARVKQVARISSNRLKKFGIHNLAILVIHNPTGTVLAYQGSQDYFDDRHAGQVQGGLAERNPGSALKPFLYGAALQTGKLGPTERLIDTPAHYADLSPVNFDRSYHGFVEVGEALRKSLNVPAVRLLQRYGVGNFHQDLRQLGFNHMEHRSSYYGLGLVLGGGGVNLYELTNGYATLAREGIYKPVRWRRNSSASDTSPTVIGEEASYLIAKMLKVEDRTSRPPFAMKTGTSSNNRDAWSVGWNPELTVGVWVGNFSNHSSPYLVGRKAAYPLVEKIFRRLYPDADGPWFQRPKGIKKRTVCADSGKPPNPHCPTRRKADYIPGVSPNRTCDQHRRIMVSADGQTRYCAVCRPEGKVVRKVVREFPPEVAHYLDQRGMLPYEIPAHDPDCPYADSHRARMRLTRPAEGATYLADGRATVPVRASTRPSNRPLHLFVNGRHRGVKPAHRTRHLSLEPGTHKIAVMTEEGTAIERTITVKSK